jgi:hypothetical protein
MERRFLAPNDSFAASENIDENGNYRINAPVGPVQLSVDYRLLRDVNRLRSKSRRAMKSKTEKTV